MTIAVLLGTGFWLWPRHAAVVAQSRPFTTAERAIQQARQAVGGTDRLDDVRTLTIDAILHWTSSPTETEPLGLEFLLPDRFKWRTQTITHTINGHDFWQSRPTAAATRARAEDNIRRQVTIMGALFLVRTSGAIQTDLTYLGTTERGGLRGDAVEIKAPPDFSVLLFFDPQYHLPLGYTMPFQMRTSSGAAGETVLRTGRIVERRVEGGISFPGKIEETTGTSRSVLEITKIAVNPPLKAADFENR